MKIIPVCLFLFFSSKGFSQAVISTTSSQVPIFNFSNPFESQSENPAFTKTTLKNQYAAIEETQINPILNSHFKFSHTKQPEIFLPQYIQGAFCNFEDYLNKNRKLQINFGVE